MIELASYPTDLWLLGRLGTQEVQLKPLLPTTVDAYSLLLEDGEDFDWSLPTFYTAFQPLPRERRTADLQGDLLRKQKSWEEDQWTLPLGVYHEGELLGMQELSYRRFGHFKTIETGSYLASAARGKGLGKLMRLTVLSWAFNELGVHEAQSAIVVPNEASLGVSKALGYREEGVEVFTYGKERLRKLRLSLEPAYLQVPAGFVFAA